MLNKFLEEIKSKLKEYQAELVKWVIIVFGALVILVIGKKLLEIFPVQGTIICFIIAFVVYMAYRSKTKFKAAEAERQKALEEQERAKNEARKEIALQAYKTIRRIIFQCVRETAAILQLFCPNAESEIEPEEKVVIKNGIEFYQFLLRPKTANIDEQAIIEILNSRLLQKANEREFVNLKVENTLYNGEFRPGIYADSIQNFGNRLILSVVLFGDNYVGYLNSKKTYIQPPRANIYDDEL